MFFSKKPKRASLNYRVYMTKVMKYQQLIHLLAERTSPAHLIYFFDETKKEIDALLRATGLSYPVADSFSFNNTIPESIILVEVHPLASVTNQLLTRIHPDSEVQAFVGLDEELMKAFGSDRITMLMEKMGMQPDEAISHTMVDKSIENAQQKLDDKLKHPKDVRTSAVDWAKENGIG